MLLLTDDTVVANELSSPNWHRLTPDSSGNYENGAWLPIAPMLPNPKIPAAVGGPTYGPLYFGSGVLKDGRNSGTGVVTFCRTADHSTLAVATGSATVSTTFTVPIGLPAGTYSLAVIANGIASADFSVAVIP